MGYRLAVLVGIFGLLAPLSMIRAGPSFRPVSRQYGVTTQPQGTQKCVWAQWTAWGGCSVNCGSGISTRMRVQTTTCPKTVCTRSERQQKPCQMPACNIQACAWRDWSAWGACSVTCGTGSTVRTRSAYAKRYGATCKIAPEKQPKACTLQACPKACTWNTWSAWGPCSATCGAAAVKTRTRTPNPATNGGAACAGSSREVVSCGLKACPVPQAVHCTWSAWATAGTCSKTCGEGVLTQTRTKSGLPQNGGTPCLGDSLRTAPCNTNTCPRLDPIDCQVTWSDWGLCSAACGQAGTHTRASTVTMQPANGGNTCPAPTETQPCQGAPCPVDCTWSDWSTVGSCSATCGTGALTQTRTQTPEQNGGQACTGSPSQNVPCNNGPCMSPINCIGTWSDWSVCNAACGATASQSRAFTVTIPAQDGGDPCPTAPESRQCQGPACPVDCTWSDWSTVGSCSATCGTGALTQTRTQTPEQNGGQACTGSPSQNVPCNNGPCPVDCTWSDWSTVGSCSATCGTGALTQTRTQTPEQNGGQACTGSPSQNVPCNNGPCPVDCTWSDWSTVGSCSATCGTGALTQTRTQTPEQNGGQACTGSPSQNVPCNNGPCPVDCTWSDWSTVGSCSATCGTGALTQARTQTPEQNGGQACTGSPSQNVPCNNGPCPAACTHSDWSSWSACPIVGLSSSNACGQRTRTRTSSPNPCTGPASLQETSPCNCGGRPNILYFVTSTSVPQSEAATTCQMYGGQLAQVTLAEITPPRGSVKLFQQARSEQLISNRCNNHGWLAFETGQTCIRWNNMNPNTCSGNLPVFCEIINPVV